MIKTIYLKVEIKRRKEISTWFKALAMPKFLLFRNRQSISQQSQVLYIQVGVVLNVSAALCAPSPSSTKENKIPRMRQRTEGQGLLCEPPSLSLVPIAR